MSARELNRLTRASVPAPVTKFEPGFRRLQRLRSGAVLAGVAIVVGVMICTLLALGATAGVVTVNRVAGSTSSATP